jgi:hypothetical protein
VIQDDEDDGKGRPGWFRGDQISFIRQKSSITFDKVDEGERPIR